MNKAADRPYYSIIIPVFKVEQYLDKCVESVLAQTYEDYELLLIDDGSPDRCPEICDRYAAEFSRVKTFHKKNGGLSSARNYGLRKASGMYVMFLDSDDYWDDKHALATLRNVADGRTDIILFRYKKYVEKTGKVLDCHPDCSTTGNETKEEIIEKLIEAGTFNASAWNKLVRKDFLNQYAIAFREGVTSEDIEWCGKLLINSRKICYCSADFYIYRQRAGSITYSMKRQNIEDLRDNIRISVDLADRYLEKDSSLYNSYMAFMAYQFCTLFLSANNVKEESMLPVLREMKPYARVLDYSDNKKVKLFRLLYRLFGISGVYRFAGIYMKVFYNRV